MDTRRTAVRNLLSTRFKRKEASKYEAMIFAAVKTILKDPLITVSPHIELAETSRRAPVGENLSEIGFMEAMYTQVAYEKVAELMAGKEAIFRLDLKKGKFQWNSTRYDALREKDKQEKDLLSRGIEVQEGEYQCKRCKSKRCIYYQMQTRSGDEGFTSFFQCTECSNRWRM